MYMEYRRLARLIHLFLLCALLMSNKWNNTKTFNKIRENLFHGGVMLESSP